MVPLQQNNKKEPFNGALSATTQVNRYQNSRNINPIYQPFSCFHHFSLVLDPTGRLAGREGKVGNACEEFEDNEGGMLMFLRALVPAHPTVQVEYTAALSTMAKVVYHHTVVEKSTHYIYCI